MEALGISLTALVCLLAAAALGSAFIYYVKDDSKEIKDLREPNAVVVHSTSENSNSKNRVSVLFAGGRGSDGVGITPGLAKKYLRTPLPRIVRTSVTEASGSSSSEEDLSNSEEEGIEETMGKDRNKVEHGSSNGDYTDHSMDNSYRDHHHHNNGPHSSSFSRVPVALHRYLPFYSHFAAARHHRKSKSMSNLNQEFIVNDPLFGPISIIGRQLTPTKSEEDEGSTRMMTFDADDEDYVDNRHEVARHEAQQAAKKLRRQQRIKTSFSVDEDEMGVVRDVIADDDDYLDNDQNDVNNMIRMIRLSEDHGSRQVSLVEQKAVGRSSDIEFSSATTTTPNVEINKQKETSRARSTKNCKECNYSTTSKRKLVRHVSKSHPIEEFQERLLFKCQLCEYATSKERRLRRHHRMFHTKGGKIEKEETAVSIKQ